jgi:adenylate cyclase
MEKVRLSRKLAVLLHADVVGSTSLVQKNETLAHERIVDAFKRFSATIESYGGIAHEIRGDALLAEFDRASDAVSTALAFLSDQIEHNVNLSDNIKPELRVGIAMGEVIIADKTMTGGGVVMAQRLEQLAESGGVVIQSAVYETLPRRLPFSYESLGEQWLKGFDETVRAYRVALKPDSEIPPPDAIAAMKTAALTEPDKPSIAVLPFNNMSGDPEQEYFSDGITEDIITALSKINNLLVIARNSTFTYKGKSVDVRQVSREQGVRYVLEGSVRKAGNRIRVTAQLIDATTSHHIWAERYDRELNDIFAVQDEIMREIVVALDVELNEGEQARIWSSGTTNVEAWECVRLGSYKAVYSTNPEVKLQAKALLEKALELDPSYAIAWVMLGWIYQQYADVASLASDSNGPETALASMLECAQKALAADPSCADAYGLLAMYHLEVKAFDQAKAMAENAISLAPNNAHNLGEVSMVLNKTGNPQRALELKKRAMRACPMYRPGFLRGLGLSYYLLSQLDSAISAFKQSIVRESEYLSAHTNLASIFGELGRLEEAKEPVREILRLAPDFSIEAYMKGLSFSDPEILTRMEEGLRKAGLPE